ncbi:MAG TPA: cellulase family glycosylhydrolase [Acidimicrobiia bacterium]|nr:cellulase family glycosylhydrolase [Acidimicrobiia bacterium]
MGRLRVASAALVVMVLASGCLAPRNPSRYGVNGDANTTAAELMRQAGFKWVRLFVGWDDLQPNGPGLDKNDLAYVDSEVNAYASKGFSVSIVITRHVPWWVRDNFQPEPCASHPNERRPLAGYFEQFMTLMALHFKDRVAAWELWNEPELDCRFPGTPADFRRLIFNPGFDAIRAAQPDAIILGPALADVTQLNAYYTYVSGGSRYLTRPVAAINIHHYGTVDDIESAMNTANSYVQCVWGGTYCVTKYWLTEFGFTESDAAGDAPNILAHCDAQKYCERAFYFAANYEGLGGQTFALLDPKTLVPRTKYYKLKEYILSKEPPLPG